MEQTANSSAPSASTKKQKGTTGKKPQQEAQPAPGYWHDRLKEPSTWLGILAIGAAFATGGTAEWLNATNIGILASGLGLVTTKDSPKKAMVK